MQVLVVNELHHIDGGGQVLRTNDGVALCPFHRVDQQQLVGTQTKTGESGEESQLHFADLMLTSDVLVRCLAGNRCQVLRCEDDIDRYAGGDHDRQHQA